MRLLFLYYIRIPKKNFSFITVLLTIRLTELCTKCVLIIKVDVIICNQMEERHMDDKTQAER